MSSNASSAAGCSEAAGGFGVMGVCCAQLTELAAPTAIATAQRHSEADAIGGN
jgi:hypothetical protein